MWFQKTPNPSEMEVQRLLDLVDSQARHIHRLETLLARVTHTPLPEPLVLPSRSPSPNFTPSSQNLAPPRKPRGAEAVSIMGREQRAEEEQRVAVQTAFKLPKHMEAPSIQGPIPEGTSVGGGFSSPPSESLPDKSRPSASLSTES